MDNLEERFDRLEQYVNDLMDKVDNLAAFVEASDLAMNGPVGLEVKILSGPSRNCEGRIVKVDVLDYHVQTKWVNAVVIVKADQFEYLGVRVSHGQSCYGLYPPV